MTCQPKSLSSSACDAIVQSLEAFLTKNQNTQIPKATVNKIMNRAIRTLSPDRTIPYEIWDLACCTKINIPSMDTETLVVQGMHNKIALHWAIQKNLNEAALLLIKKMSPNALVIRDINGYTPLHIACMMSNTPVGMEIIEKLLMLPEERLLEVLNIRDKNNRTALDIAQLKNLESIVSLLKDKMHLI